MNKKYFLFVVFALLSATLFGQEKKPDWRKLHYGSEEEMYMPLDHSDFIETDPPFAPVRNVAEFDQMQAVLIAYPEGNGSGEGFGIPINLIREMAEDCEVITIVENAAAEQTVINLYTGNNVNLENCTFLMVAVDKYWTRDYGPWFIFDGNNQPGIVDFPYNRPRPNDDEAPIHVAEYLDIDLYGMNLVHTGGNYMTCGLGKSSSTDLVWDENPGLSEEDIDSLVFHYLGIENYFVRPDPLDEYIKHIDCWGKFLSPGKVLIGEVPESDYRYPDFEAAANFFKNTSSSYGIPYEVFRVMTPGGSPATAYTNSLILNNKVFVPLSGSTWDDEAIDVYEDAMPGYEVIGIMYGGWFDTDALHCRTKGVADLGMLYIEHMPVLGLVAHQFDYGISAEITACSGEDIYSDSVFVYFSVNGSDYVSSLMEYESGNTWTGMINDIEAGDSVSYYLYAADESSRSAMHPYIGQPDPHEFIAFWIGADPLLLEPDTLLFLTFDDCVNGLPLNIINVSNDSVEITDITPWSADEGFLWEVLDMPELPLKIASDNTLTINVVVGIPVRSSGELLQDTIFVNTAENEFSSLIIVDSDLVQGLEEFDSENQVDVYPNPFQSQLWFEFDLNRSENVMVNLFDLSGRLVYSSQSNLDYGSQRIKIDASRIGLKPRTYIYKLSIGESIQTGKVIYKP